MLEIGLAPSVFPCLTRFEREARAAMSEKRHSERYGAARSTHTMDLYNAISTIVDICRGYLVVSPPLSVCMFLAPGLGRWGATVWL